MKKVTFIALLSLNLFATDYRLVEQAVTKYTVVDDKAGK